MAKVQAKASLNLDAYRIIERAVEEGVNYGWNRSRKHTANPKEQDVKEAIVTAVMNEIADLLESQ